MNKIPGLLRIKRFEMIEIKRTKYLNYAITLIIVINTLTFLEHFTDIHLPLIKYFIGTVFSIIFVYSVLLKYKNIDSNNSDILIYMLLIWTLILFLRSLLDIDELHLKRLLSGFYSFYLFPLIVIYGFRIRFVAKLIKLGNVILFVSSIILILTFSFWLNFSGRLFEEFSKTYFAISGFVFMIFFFLNQRTKIIVMISLFSILLLNAYIGRRAETIYYLLCIIFGFILNGFFGNISVIGKRKFVNSLLVFVFVTFLVLFFMANIEKFDFIIGRFAEGFENREAIIDELIYDLNYSETWIHGKGFFGEFRTRVLATTDYGTREGIENGYLQMLLKGGLIYVLLFIAISLKAIVLGYFYSKNLMIKSFSIFIFTYLVVMFGFGIPEFILRYFLVWMAIAGCYSKELRNMTNNDIILVLNETRAIR